MTMGIRKITPEALAEAACAYYFEGKQWKEICRRLDVSENALCARRKTDEWRRIVAQVLGAVKFEIIPNAWGCLLRQIRRNDTTAAKIALDRLEGATEEDPSSVFMPLFLQFRRGELTYDEFMERWREQQAGA